MVNIGESSLVASIFSKFGRLEMVYLFPVFVPLSLCPNSKYSAIPTNHFNFRIISKSYVYIHQNNLNFLWFLHECITVSLKARKHNLNSNSGVTRIKWKSYFRLSKIIFFFEFFLLIKFENNVFLLLMIDLLIITNRFGGNCGVTFKKQ